MYKVLFICISVFVYNVYNRLNYQCVLCGIWDQSMHIMHTGTSIIYCINCVMELPN